MYYLFCLVKKYNFLFFTNDTGPCFTRAQIIVVVFPKKKQIFLRLLLGHISSIMFLTQAIPFVKISLKRMIVDIPRTLSVMANEICFFQILISIIFLLISFSL